MARRTAKLRRVVAAAVGGALAVTLVAAPAARAASRPNVIIILADDMGFSDLGCYGSEIHTPNIDAMAQQGVRFAQYYTQPRCCPARASLLTGLYSHEAGVGDMNQKFDDKAAYQGELSDRCVTIAEVLRDAGYHTGMVGKWHLANLNVATMPQRRAKENLNFQATDPISPDKHDWPCNRGFEEDWGTIPGVENYYDPYGLVHNEQSITPDKPDFYYTDFIADHAVQLIDGYAADPQKPFFMYVAFTAPHWPMMAREADIEHYAGVYDAGWDAIRQSRWERQVAMGLVKREWGLSPRAFLPSLNDGDSQVGPWDTAPAPQWQARRMAVYAAMIETMDRGVGRILDELGSKKLDSNTMVVFMSDNGACQENVQAGWYDIPSQTRDGRRIEVGNKSEFMPGSQTVYQSYGPAWANASNTPLRRFKYFTEEGGISAPCIIRYPGVVKQVGEIQHNQVAHVTDWMPTVMALAGAQYPAEYHGHAILPEEGMSLLPVIRGGPSEARSKPLCWEHEGNRAVRMGDWKMLAAHNEPWKLYNIPADRTEMHDVSAEHPEIVEQLHAAYDAWVKRVGVERWPLRNDD